MRQEHSFIRIVQYTYRCIIAILVISIAILILLPTYPYFEKNFTVSSVKGTPRPEKKQVGLSTGWSAPDSVSIPQTPEGDLIRYGQDLVAHTAVYLGPGGKVSATTNGMNCQNCHLKAGKKIFGNNYSAVSSTYPKFRPRSGSLETIEKRVNDCIERSLNGQPLKENSRELRAFVAYISWVGKDVAKGVAPDGVGLWDLPLLDRAASPEKGKVVFEKYCVVCHGKDGAGLKTDSGSEWKYPPLWGESSYNTAAGLFRLSRFAGYVKANMPYGASFDNPILTDEEAWDVAAYINSMPRPHKIFSADWPDISTKPFDHPFGPYADPFSEQQHKLGPFGSIKKVKSKTAKKL